MAGDQNQGVSGEEAFEHAGGDRTLSLPSYVEDIALRIKRQERQER